MQSTFRIGNGTACPRSIRGAQAQFTISMDKAYDYKIDWNEFDPKATFPEITSLSDEFSAVLQKKPIPAQETEFENHILKCLATMAYGSNMIERAGGSSQVTSKLCLAVFRGEEVPGNVGETEEGLSLIHI